MSGIVFVPKSTQDVGRLFDDLMEDFFAVAWTWLENESIAVFPATGLTKSHLVAVAAFAAVKDLAVVGPVQRSTKWVSPIVVCGVAPVDSSELVLAIDVAPASFVVAVQLFDSDVAVEVAADVATAVIEKLLFQTGVVVLPVKSMYEIHELDAVVVVVVVVVVSASVADALFAVVV